MPITVLSVGKLKEKYLRAACDEYTKRLSRYDKIKLIEVPDIPEKTNMSEADIDKIKEQEGIKLLSHISPDDFVVALCIEAEQLSSEEFAEKLLELRNLSRNIVFVVGGSNGLGNNIISRSNMKLSFSKLTFPHQLMRVILLEQIYRAYKIISKERYHK
ncbi:MAG: 23S rRNA (pseudouridine(1915)-N(3))-methyltransferase RlmH [Christensenellales bacterium]|jgi:23S rRNA (pseudouridine1915-N3)-methyltransferase